MKRFTKLFFTGVAIAAAALITIACPTEDEGDPSLPGSIHIGKASDGLAIASALTGDTLYAVYSGNKTVQYQWKKDGEAITDAAEASYQPVEAGSYTVTVSATGYADKTSAAVTVSGDTLTPEDLLNIADFGKGAAVTTINVPDPVTADALRSTLEGLSAGNYIVVP